MNGLSDTRCPLKSTRWMTPTANNGHGLCGRHTKTGAASKREWVGLPEPELHEINPTWPAPNEALEISGCVGICSRPLKPNLKEKNYDP